MNKTFIGKAVPVETDKQKLVEAMGVEPMSDLL